MSDEDFRLERAIEIAAMGHAGQLDKAGEPYILHVLRVVLGSPPGDGQTVAALHDLIEDTGWNLESLQEEFDEGVVAAVDALTRRDGERYFDYIGRVCDNPLARTVKRADLLDNLNESRIPNPTPHDKRRWAKYRNALAVLDGSPSSVGPTQPNQEGSK